MDPTLPLPEMSSFFEVRLVKETFKFNAAHFIAFRGFRERLHGHNYTCAVRLIGSRRISSDGYLLDFGDVKKVTRSVCKELNEYFLCPMHSVVLTITLVKVDGKEMVKIVCEDGEIFLLPREDCLLLPIVHSSAEEMAIYLWSKILNGLDAPTLIRRGIHTLEVSMSLTHRRRRMAHPREAPPPPRRSDVDGIDRFLLLPPPPPPKLKK